MSNDVVGFPHEDNSQRFPIELLLLRAVFADRVPDLRRGEGAVSLRPVSRARCRLRRERCDRQHRSLHSGASMAVWPPTVPDNTARGRHRALLRQFSNSRTLIGSPGVSNRSPGAGARSRKNRRTRFTERTPAGADAIRQYRCFCAGADRGIHCGRRNLWRPFLFVHVLTEWSGRPRRRRRGWLGSSDQTWSAGEYGSGNDGGSSSDGGSSCGGGGSSCGGGSS